MLFQRKQLYLLRLLIFSLYPRRISYCPSGYNILPALRVGHVVEDSMGTQPLGLRQTIFSFLRPAATEPHVAEVVPLIEEVERRRGGRSDLASSREVRG